jgi:CheY-like chemotaxis protein
MQKFRPHVLMVDDDEADAFFVQKSFSRAKVDLEFTHVSGGRELFALLEKAKQSTYGWGPPDVVLLDINMPAMTGFEVLRGLRVDESASQFPVVMLTTSTAPKDVEQAYREGAGAYIVKPNSVEGMDAFAQGFFRYWFKLVTLPAGCR